MYDSDIRNRLSASVLAQHRAEPDTLIVEELSLGGSRSRIDVAVVNGELCGYEIKSPADTLARLGGQSVDYAAVFDRLTIVVGECHLSKALFAIPDWWGVLIACSGQEISFESYRNANENQTVQADCLVKLLWRDEALSILERIGTDYGVRAKPKKYVWRRLAETMPLPDLKRAVRATLKSRRNWKVAPGSSQCGD